MLNKSNKSKQLSSRYSSFFTPHLSLFMNFFHISFKEFFSRKTKKLFTSIPPELILMKKGNVPEYNRIQEPDFVDKISTGWIRPGLDTTYFALQIKDRLGEPLEEAEKIMEFVKSLYREDEKGFVQTESHKHASIHAIHSAIGIVNLLFTPCRVNNQLDWSKPMGKDLLQTYLGEDKAASIIKFLSMCQKNGGFAERPEGSPTTINATASALWCLWHLNALDMCNMESLLKFTEKYIVQENHKIGFKNELKDKHAWVCATYYAFRILKGGNLLDRIMPPHRRKEIISFILQCKNGKMGFGAARSFEPTIIHTKDALSLIKDTKYGLDFNGFVEEKESIDFKEKLIKDIESFLAYCRYKGVYGFAERKYYFPNIYATLLAIDIKRALKIMKKENPEESVDENQKKEILDFVNSCKECGAYRGYSYSDAYIPTD